LATSTWDDYDKSLNKYRVRVGTTLELWESKGWIDPKHPYGWIEWYFDFYSGKRSRDDEHQMGAFASGSGTK